MDGSGVGLGDGLISGVDCTRTGCKMGWELCWDR